MKKAFTPNFRISVLGEIQKLSSYKLLFVCAFLVLTNLSFTSFGQVTGTVFNDFNYNGTKDATASLTEVGLAGVTVTAYDATGASVSTISSATGSYSFPNSGVTASGKKLRIEFTNYPSFTNSGVSGGTSVQFVSAGASATNLNFGVSYPNDYCQTNPNMVTPCYAQLSTPSLHIMAMFPYNNTGGGSTVASGPGVSSVANNGQVGSLWGLAYQRSTKKLFASAVLKGHAFLGPAGLDAIYQIDPTTGVENASLWLELKDNLGIDVSPTAAQPQYVTNATRGLTDALPENDATVWTDAAKVGLGDIEISADEKILYVVNLYDKTLYAIDIATKAKVGSYAIPTTGCTAGVARPWGLGENNGNIYIAVTCDASTSGNDGSNLSSSTGVANLKAMVYKFSAGAINPTPVLSYSLGYPKEGPFYYDNTAKTINTFKPWVDVLPGLLADGVNVAYPQPIFTDIKFSDNGDMIMGFTDRTGFQMGDKNYGPTGTTLRSMYSGGDILKGCLVAGTYKLENTTDCKNTRGQLPSKCLLPNIC